MRVELLGPFRLDDVPPGVSISAAKERSVVAALALSPGRSVPVEALIAALWGDDPPPAAHKTLQTYVWNLRQVLGAEAIATEPPGYVLRVEADDVDVHRFRALVREGESALRDGDAGRASDLLTQATTLWRGEPLTGVAAHAGLAAEATRLVEERLSALELRGAADLAAGRQDEIVAELQALVLAHPYRERFWGHLMVALYRCGRQAEALAAYQQARTVLLEDLGLEPGGELRRIEEAILHHDASLAAPAQPQPVAPTAAGTPGTLRRSPVRYARSADGVGVAYQVAGEGPVDILAVPGFVTHLDIWWNAPTDGLVRRLTEIGRLISFDKRGMGLSDRPDQLDARRWVDDALAVLDAVGATDVVVLGVSAGSPTAIRLAAWHPERARGLVVFGGGARTLAGPGYEIGHARSVVEAFAANLERGWGTGVAISSYAPSRAGDPHVRGYWARYQQLSASPAAAMRSFWAAVETDVTGLLATIDVPTLVVHPERDVISPVAWGRFLADHIRGAHFVALDSDVDLICVSDVIDQLAHEVGAFVDAIVR